jgi:hypothetical protein
MWQRWIVSTPFVGERWNSAKRSESTWEMRSQKIFRKFEGIGELCRFKCPKRPKTWISAITDTKRRHLVEVTPPWRKSESLSSAVTSNFIPEVELRPIKRSRFQGSWVDKDNFMWYGRLKCAINSRPRQLQQICRGPVPYIMVKQIRRSILGWFSDWAMGRKRPMCTLLTWNFQ